VLIVPAHPMSLSRKFEGVRSVLWLPLCEKHFSAATVRELLNGDAVQGMEASINRDFRANNAVADFGHAKVEPLKDWSEEFRHYEQLQHDLAQGRVMPAGTMH
jgi:hypothetical protein